jgi:hypothetical protein
MWVFYWSGERLFTRHVSMESRSKRARGQRDKTKKHRIYPVGNETSTAEATSSLAEASSAEGEQSFFQQARK